MQQGMQVIFFLISHRSTSLTVASSTSLSFLGVRRRYQFGVASSTSLSFLGMCRSISSMAGSSIRRSKRLRRNGINEVEGLAFGRWCGVPVCLLHLGWLWFCSQPVGWWRGWRVPASAACLTKCGGEEDHRVEGGGGIELRVPSDCGEGTSRTKEKEENGGVGVGVEEFDDVGRRLEELRLGVEEVELSEEQLRINDQAQEDEEVEMVAPTTEAEPEMVVEDDYSDKELDVEEDIEGQDETQTFERDE
nr:E3 ubiquitin-protein ligase RNF14 isoform X3 [Ipomoea trifida]